MRLRDLERVVAGYLLLATKGTSATTQERAHNLDFEELHLLGLPPKVIYCEY